jgi:hypothetical protein
MSRPFIGHSMVRLLMFLSLELFLLYYSHALLSLISSVGAWLDGDCRCQFFLLHMCMILEQVA